LTVAGLENNLETRLNASDRLEEDFARVFEAPTNALGGFFKHFPNAKTSYTNELKHTEAMYMVLHRHKTDLERLNRDQAPVAEVTAKKTEIDRMQKEIDDQNKYIKSNLTSHWPTYFTNIRIQVEGSLDILRQANTDINLGSLG
jgi:CII-binding regulator of phage lambda lysogenization HflD